MLAPDVLAVKPPQAAKADVDNDLEYRQKDEEDLKQVQAGSMTADKYAENKGEPPRMARSRVWAVCIWGHSSGLGQVKRCPLLCPVCARVTLS